MNYLTDFPVNYINSSPNVILDLTYIASPTLVNEATIGYSAWSENQQFPNGQGELKAVQKSALGISLPQFRPELNPLDLIPGLIFGGGGLSKLPKIGFQGSTGTRFPISSQASSYGATDEITKVWTNHILKGGIYFHFDRFVQRHVAGNFAGLYNFSVSTQIRWISETLMPTPYWELRQYSKAQALPIPILSTRILEWYVQDT